MAYYLRLMEGSSSHQAWQIDEDTACQLGIMNPEQGIGTFFQRGSFPTIWHAIEAHTPWLRLDQPETCPFHLLDLGGEQFYPRIARPLLGSNHMLSPSAQFEDAVVATGRWQLTALKRDLERICLTVHPDTSTLPVFGHDIRNLLILAATEVEAHWRGVLVANGVIKRRYNTRDYVKLAEPLRLREYSVTFPSFPWLEPIQPFRDWDAEDPTGSLLWYDAYNATKHDRENAFNAAQLGYAFAAVAASAIMLSAQFTRSIGLGGQSELSAFFAFNHVPTWEPRESYIGFGSSKDWMPTFLSCR